MSDGEATRCRAALKDGSRRCRAPAMEGSEYCFFHRAEDPGSTSVLVLGHLAALADLDPRLALPPDDRRARGGDPYGAFHEALNEHFSAAAEIRHRQEQGATT